MFFKATFDPRAFPFLAFLAPLAVRAIPEILVGPYIIGFDTLGYYVPNVLTWLREGVGFWNFIAVAPLFYVILMGVTALGIPIVVSLKVMPPLLLGFLGLAVFFYALKALSWSPKKSLLVALIATLYFVALRISWDMLRSELGLIFLFVALTFLPKSGNGWKYGLFLSLAMISVVSSHQLVAVVMFAIVAVTIIRSYFDSKPSEVRRLVMSSVPAALLLLVIVYAGYVVSSGFSVVSGFPGRESEGWLTLFGFTSYFDMAASNLGFLVFCYLPLLPLVLFGAKHFGGNLQLKAWVFWILIALSSSLISPNAFVVGFPFRWTLMLTYPLAFYATEAIAHVRLNARGRGSPLSSNFRYATEAVVYVRLNVYRLAVGLMLATLTLGFIVLPNRTPFPYYSFYPYYVPTSMLQNTVSSSDFQDTVNAVVWLRSNIRDGGRLLAHDVFYGWCLLTLNRSQIVPIGYENPEKIAFEAVQNGSAHQLYFVWWSNGKGWHGQPAISSAFEEVYESGRIAVYTYRPSVYHGSSEFEDLRSIKS